MNAYRLAILAFLPVLTAAVACSASKSEEDADVGETGEDAITAFPNLPDGYDNKSAADKMDILWDTRIVPSTYRQLPAWPKVNLPGIYALDLSVTLNRRNDELPVGRKKLVHALGACAKVELIADADQPYSGMFKGGEAIARFSLASDPGDNNFTPGLALKFFIDGEPSTNLQVMFSIDGQGENFDFFANRFSNVISAPAGAGTMLIGKIFQKATPFPNALDLDSFARYQVDGTLDHLKTPRQIHFIPASDVKSVARANSPDVDFREDLAKIPVGTTLWKIVAAEGPNAAFVNVGKLVLRSEIISSAYGDEKLFFKHEEATRSPD